MANAQKELTAAERVERAEKAYRNAENPQKAREKFLELVEAREAAAEVQPQDRFKQSIDSWRFRNPDLAKNPFLEQQAVQEAERRMLNAGKLGERKDWDRELDDVADWARKNAGMPTREELERKEVLDDMRKARGQDDASLEKKTL
jgi:hypothetical protein